MVKQTIAAIATAMSPSGISIIRISGPEAFQIADRIFVPAKGSRKISESESHRVHYGFIVDGQKKIDEVMLLIMRAPKTYTAEDTVEIDCHGGILVTRNILDTVIKAGATLAGPGEFTKRAFLNGRIDLTKAEAVMDLIQAENDYAMQISLNQMDGNISLCIKELRDKILDDIAFIEAALDDPEHISLDGYQENLKEKLDVIIDEIKKLINTAEDGRILKEGIKSVILGKPNAGKSSLLNLLSGRKRAIVTDIAGTTRDILEEQILIDGLSFSVIDTAGIRESDDVIEQMGVELARENATTADVILYVVDSSVPLDENDDEIIEYIQDKRAIVIYNKSDLKAAFSVEEMKTICPNHPIVVMSAQNQVGIENLKTILMEMFIQGEIDYNNQVYITNARQKECLQEALNDLYLVEKSLDHDMPEDMYTIDLMNAYTNLGYIIGAEVEEDLVNRIFEKFCMGK